MSNNRRHTGILGVLAVLLTLPLAAQDRPQPDRFGPEAALRLRATLELSDQQVAELQALRQQRVHARAERMKDAMELRSRFDAGDLTPEQFRTAMQTRAEAARAQMANRGNAVNDILTETQRAKLSELRTLRMRGAPRGEMRSRGMHRQRHFGPGRRPDVRRPRGGIRSPRPGA